MRLFFLSLLMFTGLHAERTVHFDAGWQLAGLAQGVDNLSLFDAHAKIVWAYDAPTQTWQGYSPDAAVAQKLAEHNITAPGALHAHQAFWIYSNTAWELQLVTPPHPDPDALPPLELYQGWNLISLTSNAVIDTALFANETVWKYNGAWQVKSGEALPYPPADDVKTGEGFWVKSDNNRSIDLDYESSALHTFDSKEAMLEYIKKMLEERNYYYYPSFAFEDANSDLSSDDVSPEPAEDATTTNVQEDGVDEADILKHDGTTLFFADRAAGQVRMSTFASLAHGQTSTEAVLDVNGSIEGMYLIDNRLIIISTQYYYYTTYDIAESLPASSRSHFFVTWYDVSNTDSISTITTQKIDGFYRESRLHDHTLYLVSQFDPEFTYSYNTVYPENDANCSTINAAMSNFAFEYNDCDNNAEQPFPCSPSNADDYASLVGLYDANACYRFSYDANGSAWHYDYDNPVTRYGQLIPGIESNNSVQDYVTPQRLYAPLKTSQEAVITTAGAFDAISGDLLNTTSFTGYIDKTYASSTALYLVSTQYPYYYDYDNYKIRTAVYKFGLDANLSFLGRGFVDGHTLNQYSLSEKDDVLRIATTSGFSWSGVGTDNAVFTLAKANDGTLKQLGELRGLGKEGETIRAVRFIGNKGFVVTFRQTDPFYTIDMSDPSAPKKVGELEISGFSEYLHPVDDDLILSVGRDADAEGRQAGLQLQLYDVSDFANPVLVDKLLIGDANTYSEVEHNPRALAYRASDRLFGLPLYGYYNGYDVGFNIYQLEGTAFDALNEISRHSEGWYSYEGRGVIYDFNATTYGTLFKGEHVITEPIVTGAAQ